MNIEVYEAADEHANALSEAYSLTIEEWRSSREGFKAGFKWTIKKSKAVKDLVIALESIRDRCIDPASMADAALENFKREFE